MVGNLAETTTDESSKVIGILGDYFAASVTGTLTLDGSHGSKLVLTPDAARTVLLQPEATRNGVTVFVKNAGAFTLTFKDDSNADTIGTVAAGQYGYFYCDGTTWRALSLASTSGNVSAPITVEGTGSAQDVAHGLTGTPNKLWWSILGGHNGSGAAGTQCPTVSISGLPDGTNVNLTVSAGARLLLYCAIL